MADEAAWRLAARLTRLSSVNPALEARGNAMAFLTGSVTEADEVSNNLPAWSNWWVSVMLRVTNVLLKKFAASRATSVRVESEDCGSAIPRVSAFASVRAGVELLGKPRPSWDGSDRVAPEDWAWLVARVNAPRSVRVAPEVLGKVTAN